MDRGLLSLGNDKELDLNTAQKIFGYFDKSQLIDIFELILKGEEEKIINIYRKIYDQGIEPKVFINDFLELIYYFKNINLLTIESTNFSLNDNEFSNIKKLSNQIDDQVLILFWQFTIRTIEELDLVSNQNLSIEMFLIRLMRISSFKKNDDNSKQLELSDKIDKKETTTQFKNDAIDQIRNVTQEKKNKPDVQREIKAEGKILIDSFEKLLEVSSLNKEIKLKYELEKNVNLVSFEKNRMEISFNDNLDKNFVKELSLKLFEWTGQRWIISFSKMKGAMTIKDKEKINKIEILKKAQNTELYKNILEKFPDANLLDVISEKNGKEE